MNEQVEPREPERRQLLAVALGTLAGAALASCEPAPGSTRDPVAAPQPAVPPPTPGVTPLEPGAPRAPLAPPAATGAPAPVSGTEAPPPATTRGASCARALSFALLVDNGPRTSFRSTEQGTTLDWVTIALSASQLQPTAADQRLSLLAQLGQLALGYPTSLLDYSLRAASRAKRAGASDELVVAVLCHRLGMAFLPEDYAELSAALLRGYVSDDVYQTVLYHTDYAQPALRARHEGKSWHATAQRLVDEWLAPSWDASYASLPLATFEPLVRAAFALPHDPYMTRNDPV